MLELCEPVVLVVVLGFLVEPRVAARFQLLTQACLKTPVQCRIPLSFLVRLFAKLNSLLHGDLERAMISRV